MAELDLLSADIFLLADPATTLVEIPHLVGMARQPATDTALVRFEGDEYPTEFSGEGKTNTLPLTARFGKDEHAGWLALRNLLTTARDAPDRRLGLRTQVGQVDGLDDLLVVTVPAFAETGLRKRGWDLSFTATVVHYDPVV